MAKSFFEIESISKSVSRSDILFPQFLSSFVECLSLLELRHKIGFVYKAGQIFAHQSLGKNLEIFMTKCEELLESYKSKEVELSEFIKPTLEKK